MGTELLENTRALVTGGAGFIGREVVKRLANRGARIWVYDSLHPQVHGVAASPPSFPENVTFVRGDVRDAAVLEKTVRASFPNVIFHLAAETGTGQSMQEMVRYCEVNVVGTCHLLEAVDRAAPGLNKLVLAGSRAVYGEGLYVDAEGVERVPDTRSESSLRHGNFVPLGVSGTPLRPIPTHEQAQTKPASIYGSTKLMQELLVAQAGAAASWSAISLRLQNVYGPGQSLRNPYTGVLSIFSSKILSGERLDIFEDGDIVRDFVFVEDVADAFISAAVRDLPHAGVFNIGSGTGTTILQVARMLLGLYGKREDHLDITGHYRVGDVRHAVGDIQRATKTLHWKPRVELKEGLRRLAHWCAQSQEAAEGD